VTFDILFSTGYVEEVPLIIVHVFYLFISGGMNIYHQFLLCMW